MAVESREADELKAETPPHRSAFWMCQLYFLRKVQAEGAFFASLLESSVCSFSGYLIDDDAAFHQKLACSKQLKAVLARFGKLDVD